MKKINKTLVITFLFVGIMITYWHVGQSQTRYMLKRLDMSKVESISVYSRNAKQEAELSENEAFGLLCQLNKVELIGRKTKEYTEYAGSEGFPMIHIKLNDGKEIDFATASPFYLIDTEEFGFQLRSENIWGYRNGDSHEDYIICQTIGQTCYYLQEKYFPHKESIFTPSTESDNSKDG